MKSSHASMTPLPGFVPTQKSQPTSLNSNSQAPRPKVRADFARELETRLTGWLGRPGSDRFDHLKPAVEPYLKTDGDTPKIDIEKLPETAQEELYKLQKATEGIEAIFVKKLLSQMRSVSFSGEKQGPMADFAKDMIDQAVADQASHGRSSIGIARMIFLDTAQTMVRSAIAKPLGEAKDIRKHDQKD